MREKQKIIKISKPKLKCANIKNNIIEKVINKDIRLYLTSKDKNVNKKRKLNKTQKIKLMLSGAVIGFLNGFFGGGGGMVCVPILERILKYESKESHATAIAIIFPLSMISACIYIFNGFIQSKPLLVISLGSLLGGILGAFILKILPSKAVKIIFALIMLAGGIKLLI